MNQNELMTQLIEQRPQFLGFLTRQLRSAAAAEDVPVAPAPEPEARPSAQAIRKVERLTIVAIDPGHGGEDPGAIGPTGLKEKDVVLAVALRLRDKLNALPGLRAVPTPLKRAFNQLDAQLTAAINHVRLAA